MRKILGVFLLILLLAGSASADIMPNGSPQPPPPQPSANVTQEPTTDGYIPNDMANGMTQIALDLLAVLPSLH